MSGRGAVRAFGDAPQYRATLLRAFGSVGLVGTDVAEGVALELVVVVAMLVVVEVVVVEEDVIEEDVVEEDVVMVEEAECQWNQTKDGTYSWARWLEPHS